MNTDQRCTSHALQVTRALAVQEVNCRDGYPSGYVSVIEYLHCPNCESRGVRDVYGTRARSAGAAMALYRARGGRGAFT